MGKASNAEIRGLDAPGIEEASRAREMVEVVNDLRRGCRETDAGFDEEVNEI